MEGDAFLISAMRRRMAAAVRWAARPLDDGAAQAPLFVEVARCAAAGVACGSSVLALLELLALVGDDAVEDAARAP